MNIAETKARFAEIYKGDPCDSDAGGDWIGAVGPVVHGRCKNELALDCVGNTSYIYSFAGRGGSADWIANYR